MSTGDKRPSAEAEKRGEQDAAYEDFFTSFLTKKKKTLMKKIDKIISLKASPANLNQEQKEMMQREEELRRQIQHYSDIRELYLTAMSRPENEQSNWMTPDAKLRGLLGLYMTRGEVPSDLHNADELNKSYSEVFEASTLEEAVHSGMRFADNKLLNNNLLLALSEGEAVGREGRKTQKAAERRSAADAAANPPAEYEGEYSNPASKKAGAKPRAAEQVAERQAAEAPQKKQVKPTETRGKFMQSDDEDEEKDQVPPPRQTPAQPPAQPNAFGRKAPANPNIVLLPETQEKEAEEWIKVGVPEERQRRERRGERGGRPRRDAPQNVPREQEKPRAEEPRPQETAAPAPTQERPAERRPPRPQNRNRNNQPRGERREKNYESEYVRKE